MMKGFFKTWLVLAAGLVLYVVGCSEKGDQIVSPSFSTHEEYFSSVVDNDDFFTTEEPNLEDGDHGTECAHRG